MQAAEKCAPGLKDILKTEKNQLFPRDAIDIQNGIVSSGSIGSVPLAIALQHKEGAVIYLADWGVFHHMLFARIAKA